MMKTVTLSMKVLSRGSMQVPGGTYPAHGAEALVDPLVPIAGSRVLVFGRQSFVTSVEICRETQSERREVRAGNKQPAVIPDMDTCQCDTSVCRSF